MKNSSESECDKKSTISVYDILDKTEKNKNEYNLKRSLYYEATIKRNRYMCMYRELFAAAAQLYIIIQRWPDGRQLHTHRQGIYSKQSTTPIHVGALLYSFIIIFSFRVVHFPSRVRKSSI